ncbi:MAG: NnrU family protein [Sphingomonas sp.]
MDGLTLLALASASFVATHFLLSHPLRAPLVKALGAGGFMGVYSLVAFGTLGWMAHAYKAAPATAPYWEVGDGIWTTVTIVMLLASLLLMGSLIGNPALPGPAPAAAPAPRGVFTITRHPMLWSFALWALCHIAIMPNAANLIVSIAILVLALAGAALQDAKKAALQPDMWRDWQARTSWLPFAAIATGKVKLGGFRPHDWAGAIVLWLAATWAHIPGAGVAAGVWRWL